jgi:methylglutamate dehydrogenase subunit B
MRIECPFCGERDLEEFAYFGDAGARRPDVEVDASAEEARRRYVEAIYFLDNPGGEHIGLWRHRAGCGGWLKIRRNARTHEILEVALARSEATK